MAETGEGGTARYFCAAEGCHADTLKKGRHGYMHDVDFFAFPTQKKDPKGRRTWINLLRRKDYDPLRHHRVRFICNIPKLQRLSFYFLKVSVTFF